MIAWLTKNRFHRFFFQPNFVITSLLNNLKCILISIWNVFHLSHENRWNTAKFFFFETGYKLIDLNTNGTTPQKCQGRMHLWPSDKIIHGAFRLTCWNKSLLKHRMIVFFVESSSMYLLIITQSMFVSQYIG